MELYYHINKDNTCNWKVGDEIDLSKEDNFYWQSFSETSELIEINGEKFDVYQIATNAFDAYIRKYPPPMKMKDYHFNSLRTLKETMDSLGNAVKTVRELAFELVRKDFYPELPSRQKCIWLIPDDKKSLEYWKNVIQNKDKRIFKITVNGKIHRAAPKWLNGGTFSLNKWTSMAHSYWQGEESGNIEDEILFEGKIKIIEEITVPNKGSS